jgi:predicted DCC family thiol-disulfide oxidoreductase YuxK
VPPERVVLFDGYCSLCDGAVRFIMARDPTARFRFAALQSEAAQSRLRAAGAPSVLPDSVLLLDTDGLHVRSEAALRIARQLRAPWPLLARFASIVPHRWRDALYDVIARRRYAWFGRRDSCRLPTPDEAARFLS